MKAFNNDPDLYAKGSKATREEFKAAANVAANDSYAALAASAAKAATYASCAEKLIELLKAAPGGE